MEWWKSGRATLISRLRLDASLFAPPAGRTARIQGRPAQKGAPLPKLSALLADPATCWERITVLTWYGRQIEKPLEIITWIALWYRRGTPPQPIRWVLVRDRAGKRAPQAFFSTDTALAPAEIIAILVRRWQVEVTFSEVRAHLGVETQRQSSDKAIERTTPALLGLSSLITLWARDFLRQGAAPYAAAWLPQKRLHLHRCHRRRPPLNLDRRHSRHLPAPPRRAQNTPGPPHPHGRCTLLRGVMRKAKLTPRFARNARLTSVH